MHSKHFYHKEAFSKTLDKEGPPVSFGQLTTPLLHSSIPACALIFQYFYAHFPSLTPQNVSSIQKGTLLALPPLYTLHLL